ncbi:hypothetical protein EV361DRAFT_248904 [Lentinula raphanica]|nr:hypothetical protein EV361DRAFT_248904 [Lentinula raphanica]
MLHLNSAFSKTMAFVMLMFLTIGQSTALPLDNTKAVDTSFRTTKKYPLQTKGAFPVFFWASEEKAFQLNQDHIVLFNSDHHYLQPMYYEKMYDRQPGCWLCKVTLHETAARAEAPLVSSCSILILIDFGWVEEHHHGQINLNRYSCQRSTLLQSTRKTSSWRMASELQRPF